MQNFDPARYAGKWYETLRDPGNYMSAGTDCITKEYAMDSEGNLNLYFRAHINILFSY